MAHRRKARLRLAVRVPPKRRHRARYISPSTKSVLFSVTDSTGYNQVQTVVNVGPNQPGCTKTYGYWICTTTVEVPFGADTFNITAYDQNLGYGNALSGIYNYPFTVGTGSQLSVGLDAIPASMGVIGETATNPLLSGDYVHGFQIAGMYPGKIQIIAYDADGNLILGSGAPTLSLTSSSSAVSITAGANANEFVVTPTSFQSNAIPLTATVTPLGAGYAMTVNTTLTLEPLLYVGNYGDGNNASYVTAYVPWSATPVETISSGIDQIYGMLIDSAGNLYVSNYGASTVTEFAPMSQTPSRTIPNVVANQYGMALDSTNNLYVSSLGSGSGGSVMVFAPGATTPSYTITGFAQPYGVAVDAANNVYVADQGANCVNVYPPGSTTPSVEMSIGMSGPWQLAFDSQGNLYVANDQGNDVTEYSPPFSGSSSPVMTFSSGIQAPQHIALDSARNLYVVNPGSNSVTEYSSAGALLRTMKSGFDSPYWVSLDGSNNAYVASYGRGTVPVYASGTSLKPSNTFYSGMLYPSALAIWP
jgi:sugar lactone lactonase YvrE